MSKDYETLDNASLDRDPRARELRAKILADVREYFSLTHAALPFRPGASMVPVSGKVFDGA
jgi:hypothetical protein